MKTKDSSRKWMWWFLGVVLAMQLYFVRELLAAFALFVLGFGAIAFRISSIIRFLPHLSITSKKEVEVSLAANSGGVAVQQYELINPSSIILRNPREREGFFETLPLLDVDNEQ